MAPELFDPELDKTGYDGFQSDVYSLGATLFNMVAGRPPFLANSAIELRAVVEEQGVMFPPNVTSHSLRHLLRHMLEKDPKKRLTLEDIMNHDWVTVEGSDPMPRTSFVRIRKAGHLPSMMRSPSGDLSSGTSIAGSTADGAMDSPAGLTRFPSQSGIMSVSSRRMAAGRVVRGSRRTRRASLHRSEMNRQAIDAAIAAASADVIVGGEDGSSQTALPA